MSLFNENINIINDVKLVNAYVFKLQEYLTGFCINVKQVINL